MCNRDIKKFCITPTQCMRLTLTINTDYFRKTVMWVSTIKDIKRAFYGWVVNSKHHLHQVCTNPVDA